MNFSGKPNFDCADCPIQHRALCARCDDDELAMLNKIKSYKTYKAKETISWRGDHQSHFSSVVSGVATLSKSMEDGRTHMVGLLLPSDYIGNPNRTHAPYDVTATTDVTLCRFEREAFQDIVRDVPHISQRMLEMALDELDAARDWMVLLGRKTAQEKVATFLDMLARRAVHPERPESAINLPLTREEMATFLGLTLETVSRQLSILKKEGTVEFIDRRHFKVLDMNALKLNSGDDADGDVIY